MAGSTVFWRSTLTLAVALGFLAGPLPAVSAQEAPAPAVQAPTQDGPLTEPVAAAKAAATGHDVTVEEATTPTEETVAHPDGTFTRTINTEPVRMETATGWQDINTDLVHTTQDGAAVIKPAMAPVNVTLGAGGSAAMATLDDKAGHTLHQSWPFGNLPTPVLADNTATYPSVLPGVDLIQIAHKNGVSQVLRIATPEAAKDPRVVQMRIFLDSGNTTVHDTGAGGLEARGTDSGEPELRTAEGQWWDSSQTGASALDSGGPGLTRPFSLSLGTENGQQTQVFGMDEILNTEGLVYPLYVDPDWSTVRVSYLYVDTAYPNTPYWNGQYTDTTGHVGYLPSYWSTDGMNHTTRTFYQFDTWVPYGKNILDARMNVWESWASSCTPTPVDAWVTGGINSGTTWNNQPGLVAKADSRTVAMGYPGCAAGTVGFDLNSVKSIMSTVGQWTVSLRAANEGDPLGWKRFGNDASLIVTYNTPPTTPGVWTVSNALWTGVPWASEFVTRVNRPTFEVSATDPDGIAGGNLRLYLTIRKAASPHDWVDFTAVPRPVPGWSGRATWTPDEKLDDGNYYLEGQSVDNQNAASGLMRFDFTVDTKAPEPPTITPIGSAINPATHTDPAGTVGVDGYDFALANTGKYDAKGWAAVEISDSGTP
ncbi:hypothetical protein [Arthrobacter sp. 35W]|uniref:hypothetical protein n=1 Tax=Arthrobacter sp. 35W TaxID=1132441 RepID=UPI00040229A3|nr:hypothetical protein [Arthrobacter sp. 35W]